MFAEQAVVRVFANLDKSRLSGVYPKDGIRSNRLSHSHLPSSTFISDTLAAAELWPDYLVRTGRCSSNLRLGSHSWSELAQFNNLHHGTTCSSHRGV